ncbi:acyl carrier protein [Paraburkholderia fungorum]|uniref:acyl carrier protein n=1 Tax=Paraburkholderia fungorum TaxID=134537 RepID=UPI0017EE5B63
MPGATVRVADGTAEQGSLIERLLAHAQDVQDTSAQQLSQHLDQLDAGRISTSDMLRLQADMGAFSVRVQMTVRVADETGRAIQTLSQRS